VIQPQWRLWRAGESLCNLDGFEPRLDSWNRSDHPDQVRLTQYLRDISERVGPLPSDGPLFLSLGVDVRLRKHLLRFHDLENYAFPLFRTGVLPANRFVFVSATKRVGGGSALRIGVAEASDDGPLTGWGHCVSAPGSGTQTKAWKERIRNDLIASGLRPIADGPVAIHMAWRGAARRNWTWLWKPTGDAMGPILGENRPYNPRDDRIVELYLHWDADNAIGHDVQVGLWWRALDTPQVP
jgi:hypothetical protein